MAPRGQKIITYGAKRPAASAAAKSIFGREREPLVDVTAQLGNLNLEDNNAGDGGKGGRDESVEVVGGDESSMFYSP